MATSQNGWPVLEPGSSKLRTFVIPAKSGEIRLRLRDGSGGFLLCHFLLWYAEVVERLHLGWCWGHAVRAIRGQTTGYSNHSSGTAADANAPAHPLGTRTLTRKQKALMWVRLRLYRGCLRHGAFYSNRVDEMHVEVDRDLSACEKRARALMSTSRGRRLLKANPGLKEVILS